MRVDQAVGVPGLSAYGVTTEHHAAIAEKAFYDHYRNEREKTDKYKRAM